jgi:hypothetical protein
MRHSGDPEHYKSMGVFGVRCMVDPRYTKRSRCAIFGLKLVVPALKEVESYAMGIERRLDISKVGTKIRHGWKLDVRIGTLTDLLIYPPDHRLQTHNDICHVYCYFTVGE